MCISRGLALFFVRSGFVSPGPAANPFGYTGNAGRWWSSRSESHTDFAYGLYITANANNNPSDYGRRYYGFSLRCLSTVLDI